MDFLTLKYSATNPQQDRVENKLRIMLSEVAYEVLLNDWNVLMVGNNEEEAIIKPSSEVINFAFACYKGSARASIAQEVEKAKYRIIEILSEKIIDSSAESIATELTQHLHKELKEQAHEWLKTKEREVYFRVNKENLDYLISDIGQGEADAYAYNVGSYFKAVIEEFCRLPFIERVRFWKREQVEKIQNAINEKTLLRIETSKSKVLSGKINVTYIKPLRIQNDSENLYSYVVGMCAPSSSGPWHPGAVRLTSVFSCKKQERSATITAKDQQMLKEIIKQTGVQYLSDSQNVQPIVVELTSQGERMYKRLLHLRPQYEEALGNHRYRFVCSARLAENYFFKFGSNAKIISPQYLADKFHRMYIAAVKKYESS